MEIPLELLDGRIQDPERILDFLRTTLMPAALKRTNGETLPFQMAIYEADVIPTNQRNLTDVRTRMGVLLEYELAKAVNDILPAETKKTLQLTYVISNKYPDLAFRTRRGDLGVRFEVKSLQTIAEEKSANFDTLIKDIRKGTDFVVVLIWEWAEDEPNKARHPLIEYITILDAYDLAVMRDCYWLNTPPGDLGSGRQGYDLCFGINSGSGGFNQEEGNYGKLMRIFEPAYEKYLPESVLKGSTLQEYYRFSSLTIALGIHRISRDIARAFVKARGGDGSGVKQTTGGLPGIHVATAGKERLLIVGNDGLPRKDETVAAMKKHGVDRALIMNEKFKWSVRDLAWKEIAKGTKPAGAIAWAETIQTAR